MIYQGFEVRPHLNHPKSYIIVHQGKAGKIPDMLKGMFTDYAVAKAAIDQYVENKGA